MADGIVMMGHSSQAVHGAATASGGRTFFWMAVVVVGITFFTSEFSLLSHPEDFWTDDLMEPAESDTQQRVVRRSLAYILLLCFGSWSLIRKTGAQLAPRGLLIPLTVLFVGWCLLSVGWSMQPKTSLMRWIQLACVFVAALGLSRRLSPQDVCLLVLIVFTSYTLLGLFAELAYGAFQPWIAGYRFSGGVHPNLQSQYCLIICVGAVAMLGDAEWPRRRSVGLLLLGAPLLLLTGSRGACVSVLVAVLFYLWVRARPGSRLLIGLALPAAAIIVVILLSSVGGETKQNTSSALLLGRSEGAESLTGRLPMWAELWDFIEQRPLTGYGFGGFWSEANEAELDRRLGWIPSHAHNASIHALLCVGLIGAVLFWLIAVLGWWRSLTRYMATRDSGDAFLLLLFAAYITGSFVESDVLLAGFVTLLALIGVVQLANASPRQAAQRTVNLSGRLEPS